jgi:hypothetical protein
MFWRALRSDDLISCLEVDPQRMGAELIGKERAVEAWRALMRCCSFQAAVIETERPIEGRSTVGFGANVFVTRTFVENEISNPRPGLNARIIESLTCGEPVVLNKAQLRSANTENGLDLVVLYPQWRKGVLTAGQVRQVQSALAAAFLEGHRGFRLNRILCEVVNGAARVFYLEPAGVWRVITEFSQFYLDNPDTKWNQDRCLAIVSRQEAFQVPGHIVGILFEYRDPVLGLSEPDQRLLSAALGGLTDEELADRLKVGLPAVKKRWRSIFERVSTREDLFPGLGDDAGAGSRGRQKRHYILAYVREHPEELRPFATRVCGGNA